MNPIVIKYGGSAMDNSELLREVSSVIANVIRSGRQIVVVHGGGKEISRWLERLGIEPKFKGGLRITD